MGCTESHSGVQVLIYHHREWAHQTHFVSRTVATNRIDRVVTGRPCVRVYRLALPLKSLPRRICAVLWGTFQMGRTDSNMMLFTVQSLK